MKVAIKRFLIILGIILISILGYIYFFYFGEKVKILIPKGYIGPVIITFDCSQGEKKEYENDWRILKIKNNGMLKTQFSYDMKNMMKDSKQYFFYSEQDNDLISIKNSFWTNIHSDEISVFADRTYGTVNSNGTISYSFLVGYRSELLYYEDERGKKIRSSNCE